MADHFNKIFYQLDPDQPYSNITVARLAFAVMGYESIYINISNYYCAKISNFKHITLIKGVWVLIHNFLNLKIWICVLTETDPASVLTLQVNGQSSKTCGQR